VRVAPQEQRAIDPLPLAVAAHRLGDGQDVGLVEGPRRRGPAVPRGAEGHALAGDRRIGPLVEVGADEGVHVDEVGRIGQAPRVLRDAHPPRDRRPCHWSKATATRMRTPMMICR
jgi:hypothetical protein